MRGFGRFAACAVVASMCCWAVAQDGAKKDSHADHKHTQGNQPKDGQHGGMDMEQMMAMMEKMAALGEQHKQLEYMVGTWDYTCKTFMGGQEDASTGRAVCKPVMNGRFFQMEHQGKFSMPGPDGKEKAMEFHGISVTGFDNQKQKFVSTWIDNMSTGIMHSEGTFDPSSKTYTYMAEMPDCMNPAGGMVKIRETIKIVDKDHYVFEFFETRAGSPEERTMEITYTRAKGA